MKYVFFTLLIGILLYFAVESVGGEDVNSNESTGSSSGTSEKPRRDSEPDPNNPGFSRRRTPRQ
jgi:hypothetical protein